MLVWRFYTPYTIEYISLTLQNINVGAVDSTFVLLVQLHSFKLPVSGNVSDLCATQFSKATKCEPVSCKDLVPMMLNSSKNFFWGV